MTVSMWRIISVIAWQMDKDNKFLIEVISRGELTARKIARRSMA